MKQHHAVPWRQRPMVFFSALIAHDDAPQTSFITAIEKKRSDAERLLKASSGEVARTLSMNVVVREPI